MKKIVLLIATFVLILGLTACSDVCVGPECITGETGSGVSENAIPFTHINGHGEETDKTAFVLYEFEVGSYVRYQISYLACTCRPDINNYWSVAFIEINKSTNDIRSISYELDAENGHYYSGVWGDSQQVPEVVTFETYKTEFFPWLIGQSLTSLDGISIFHNGDYHGTTYNTTTIAETGLIDTFTGSSVSTNNMIRVFKELLAYHEAKY